MTLVVVESPLRGKTPEATRENLRYLLWCCRAETMAGNSAIASHLNCPWYLDDAAPEERRTGIEWAWAWQPNVPHHFFDDHDFSNGMALALERCERDAIPHKLVFLAHDYPRFLWDAYQRGEWPPHTAGFEVPQ